MSASRTASAWLSSTESIAGHAAAASPSPPTDGKRAASSGALPGEHQPVDAAEEPQRHRLLVARVELAGEEPSDRSAGEDVVGHALEKVGVER